MKIPVFHIVVVAALAMLFMHFLGAGARTFGRSRWDEGGVQAEVLFTLAMLAPLILGLFYRVERLNGSIALALGVAAVSLYEWARHTVQGLGLHVIMSDHVPETLCESGPYRRVRHPFYASYLIAYLALLIAIPSVWTAIAFLAAGVWLIRGARHDERTIQASPLGEAYADYTKRTGMFVPALGRAVSG